MLRPKAGRVPDSVTAAARAAFDAPRPEELAVLVYDSLVDAGEPPQKHVLRFQHSRLDLELHLSTDGTAISVQGMLDQAGPATATLHIQGTDSTDRAEVQGVTFEFFVAAHGLARISIEAPREPVIWTDWFRI